MGGLPGLDHSFITRGRGVTGPISRDHCKILNFSKQNYNLFTFEVKLLKSILLEVILLKFTRFEQNYIMEMIGF